MLHVFLDYTTPRDWSNAEAEGVVTVGEAADLTEVRPVPLALPCHLPPWSRVPSFRCARQV